MKYILYTFSLLFLFSCQSNKNNTNHNISFYHWQSDFKASENYTEALESSMTNEIYVHYFDIEKTREADWRNDGIFPTYVLRNIDQEYKGFNIIPVVYITNEVFYEKELKIEKLAIRISKLIDQISEKQLGKKVEKIQLDCDWTKTTRYSYFQLINQLKTKYQVEATIRLHQIKFADETGVPPISKGTLMLYNMGDLKDNQQNSIISSKITGDYINTKSSYAFPLDIALPLFSQTVVKNKEGKLKLIKGASIHNYSGDNHFTKISDTQYEVAKDTLFKGFYLQKGFTLKLEESKPEEVLASYKIIKESNLETDKIIFYHLDNNTLKNIDLKTLISQL